MTTEDPKRLAKDVATELARRARRRKLVLYLALAAAIALAVVYGTCGRGWGLGAGKGEGPGAGSVKAVVAAPVKRCAIRVDAKGITVDAAATQTVEAAVAACKATPGADVTVTGDAREGAWSQLRDALAAAHVEVALHDAAAR